MSSYLHWHEGLFLQPHHLQRFQRDLQESVVAERNHWTLGRAAERREAPVGRVDPWLELGAAHRGLRGRAGVRVDTLLSPDHLPRAGLSPS